jgi:hypothetical protein
MNPAAGRSESGFGRCRLEQLNRISGWILEQDLFPTRAYHNVVPESRARFAEPCDHGLQIIDLDSKPIPAPWHLLPAIRHWLSATRSRIRRAEYKPEIAAGEHCEGRSRVHHFVESQLLDIKNDSRIDIVDNVAHLNCRHALLPRRCDGGRSANRERQRPATKCSCRIDGFDEYRQIANRPSGTSEREREREFTRAERRNSNRSEVAQEVRLSHRDTGGSETCRINKLKLDLIQKQRRR